MQQVFCVSGSCTFNRLSGWRAGSYKSSAEGFNFTFAMPFTRSKSSANGAAALGYHDIATRVRKMERDVFRLQRMIRNNGRGTPGADGANDREGAPGADGVNGQDGTPGADGANGRDGAPGVDGVSGRDGANGRDGAPGADGANGRDGAPGADGVNGRDGAPGADGANGRDGAPGADGANGRDGAPGADGVNGQDGAPGVDEVDCLVLSHPDQSARHLQEGDCLLMASELNVLPHRIVVRVIGPSASNLSLFFNMRRSNTFTPLKRFVIANLGLGQDIKVIFVHQGHSLPSSATPDSIGVPASKNRMVLTFILL